MTYRLRNNEYPSPAVAFSENQRRKLYWPQDITLRHTIVGVQTSGQHPIYFLLSETIKLIKNSLMYLNNF